MDSSTIPGSDERGPDGAGGAVNLTVVGVTSGYYAYLPVGQTQQQTTPTPPQTPPLPTGTDKDKVSAFNKAFQELLKRLQNKPACAALFGGLNAAYTALSNAQFAFTDLGAPVFDEEMDSVIAVGAQINRGTTRPTVEINSQGPFLQQVRFVAGKGLTTLDFGTGRRGAQFGAIILLHELGHLAGIFGPDRGNQKLNGEHTQRVLTACFE